MSIAGEDGEGESSAEIDDCILEVINNDSYISAPRLHNLIYISELNKIERNKTRFKRLTNAEFMPYFTGAYSYQVQQSLNQLEIEREKISVKGKDVAIYHGNYETDLLGEDQEIIKEVCEIYDDLNDDQLANRVTSTWLYRTTDFEEPMDFHKYYRYITQ